MKRNLFLALLISTNMMAQNWSPLNTGLSSTCRWLYSDSLTNSLYVSGNFHLIDSIPINCIARWNGSQWDSLGSGLTNFSGNFISYDGNLYACGGFSVFSDPAIKSLAKWNGIKWDSITVQPNFSFSKYMACLATNNGLLYVGGAFDTIGGIPANSLAKWDGASWSSLEFPNFFPGQPFSFANIQTICFYNNKLYVGGVFHSSPVDTVGHILSYDGVSWKSLAGGIHGNISGVSSMLVYNNELYVAGLFTKADGNFGNNIQKWNGTTWSDVEDGTIGLTGGNGQIHSMTLFQNELYVCGVFGRAGGILADRIAKYDGTKWCSLGSTFDNTITRLAVFHDSLFIGGGFHLIDGDSVNYIAKWTGGNYVDTCSNLNLIVSPSLNSSISIYPNPAADELNIKFGNKDVTSIQILNLVSEEVRYYTITGNANNQGLSLDIRNYPVGIYNVVASSKEGRFVKKFVKIK